MRKSLTSEIKGDRIPELLVVEERVTDEPKEHIKEVTYILFLLTIPWTKDIVIVDPGTIPQDACCIWI